MKLLPYNFDIVGKKIEVFLINDIDQKNKVRQYVGKVVRKRKKNKLIFLSIILMFGRNKVKFRISTLSPFIVYIKKL
ncbi:hypothetical protein ACWNYH_00305 [Candidatus Vidania fulgoroideorum]